MEIGNYFKVVVIVMHKKLPEKDRDILRRLAEQKASIGSLPIHKKTKHMWERLNDLDSAKPMVWVAPHADLIPWHELNFNDELTLQTSNVRAREHEQNIRRELYQWQHFPGDMVVDSIYYVDYIIHDTGFGIAENSEIISTEKENPIFSHRYRNQISDIKDVKKIKIPKITFDSQATEEEYNFLFDAFGDILPIKKRGITISWFAPWDELISWYGVQEMLTDIAERPEIIHACIDRLITAHNNRLQQYENLNLLSLNNNSNFIGSGGYGFTKQLPGHNYNPSHVTPKDMWGCCAAQIFASISPTMFNEFALKHELKWLERFGLTYYGCCEPLDDRLEYLRKVPNLRKISMSPWVTLERGAKVIEKNYVFSWKPNPVIFTNKIWNPDEIRTKLRKDLAKLKNLHVEIIMKDVSTVCNEPKRLWDWVRIAKEESER